MFLPFFTTSCRKPPLHKTKVAAIELCRLAKLALPDWDYVNPITETATPKSSYNAPVQKRTGQNVQNKVVKKKTYNRIRKQCQGWRIERDIMLCQCSISPHPPHIAYLIRLFKFLFYFFIVNFLSHRFSFSSFFFLVIFLSRRFSFSSKFSFLVIFHYRTPRFF